MKILIITPIGDVVVATTTVEHDYNNKFSQRSAPKFEGAQTVIAALQRAVWLPNSFRVHFGVIASGDEDVIETERRRTLQQATGALVVAWEGAGGARACAFSNVPFVEIRGVTDTANHNAAFDYEMNLEVAMSHVARVVANWLRRASTRKDMKSKSPANRGHAADPPPERAAGD